MHVTTLFIWFILYSILGWIYETIYCSIRKLKWENRGMLIGPYCPIYGIGAVLDILLCGELPGRGAVFLTCMLGSAVLEYTTSYLTERLFHAVWWDYSSVPFNIKGRVCLPCSLGFGAAGLIVLYGIHPYLRRITDPVPPSWQEAAALLFMAVFAADCALTADSLIAVNAKLDAAIKAIDQQISEKYDAFIESARQNLSEGLAPLKEKISLEEFRERRMKEESKKAVFAMNWAQMHALRSSVAFRRTYMELGDKMKHVLNKKRGAVEKKKRQKGR